MHTHSIWIQTCLAGCLKWPMTCWKQQHNSATRLWWMPVVWNWWNNYLEDFLAHKIAQKCLECLIVRYKQCHFPASFRPFLSIFRWLMPGLTDMPFIWSITHVCVSVSLHSCKWTPRVNEKFCFWAVFHSTTFWHACTLFRTCASWSHHVIICSFWTPMLRYQAWGTKRMNTRVDIQAPIVRV